MQTLIDYRNTKCQMLLNNKVKFELTNTIEGMTGADIFITKSDRPVDYETIDNHLGDEGNAIMIQVKHGLDFNGSVIDRRLPESIDRMRLFRCEARQRILLLVGKFEIRDNHLYINNQRSSLSANSYYGALASWSDRGGIVLPIVHSDYSYPWVIKYITRRFVLEKNKHNKPTKLRALKEYENPVDVGTTDFTFDNINEAIRQSTVDPNDIRHALVNINGISSDIANNTKIYFETEGLPLNMGSFIEILLDGRISFISGLGPKRIQKIKEYLGYG